MKIIKLITGAAVLMMMTGCVVYGPPPYPYGPQRVTVQRAPDPNHPGYEYEYVEPAYPGPPTVVIDPFFWLFGPWFYHGYDYGPHGYYNGHYSSRDYPRR